MSDLRQSISVSLNKAFADNLNKIDKQKFANSLSDLVVELIIKRTQAGYDVNGRKFGNYNAGYNKAKAQKYARKKSGLTEYASTSKSNKLQLTGSLFSSIEARAKRFTISKRGVTILIEAYIADSFNRLKAEGLQSTTGYTRNSTYSKKSWDFFGLAKSGNFANVEAEAIRKLVQKEFGKVAGGGVKVGVN